MFQVNQVLYAKADCMNNFRRHQQVTLTEQVSPTSFIVDDVVELQSSVLEQYFMTEEQYKALSENNSSTHALKYLSMFKQGNLEHELEGLVGKDIKASGTIKHTYNHPFNGDVEETRPYGFEGLIIGYSKELVVENGVRAYKYMLLTNEGMAFSVTTDMVFEVLDTCNNFKFEVSACNTKINTRGKLPVKIANTETLPKIIKGKQGWVIDCKGFNPVGDGDFEYYVYEVYVEDGWIVKTTSEFLDM